MRPIATKQAKRVATCIDGHIRAQAVLKGEAQTPDHDALEPSTAGVRLSQIGEFSFVMALVGYPAGIIGEFD